MASVAEKSVLPKLFLCVIVRKKQEFMPQTTDLYRPNAAIIYQRSDGSVLVCERVKPVGAWQFPQGGIKKGESALSAACREGMAETGFRPNEYEVVAEKGPYRYDYPPAERERVLRKRGIPYAGQEQYYFLCRMHSDAAEPWLDNKEFRAYKWVQPAAFDFDALPDFKRGVYACVMKDFFGVEQQA